MTEKAYPSTLPPPLENKMGRPLFSNATEMVTFHVGKDGVEEDFTSPPASTLQSSKLPLKVKNSRADSKTFGQTRSRLFIQWLYSVEFTAFDEEDLENENIASEKAVNIVKQCEDRDLEMAQLWLLAEKLKIPRLQNEVMELFWEIFEIQGEKHDGKFWSTKLIQYIYQEGRTPPDSPLRHLAVDFVLYEVFVEWPAAHPDHFPHQMLLELTSRISLVPVPCDATGREFVHNRVKRNYMVAEDDP